MGNVQLSLFDLSQHAAQVHAPSSGDEAQDSLLKHWSNSQDLAFCVVNILLHPDELLFEFVEHVKTCRLAEFAEDIQRPTPHKRFDRLAKCLKRLEFTLVQRGDKDDVILTETTVLDLVMDVSFDEEELRELRAFGVAGASTRQVEGLMEGIRNSVEKDDEGEGGRPLHPYIAILRRLGTPEESMPEASDKEAVLKALLDGIGTSVEKFEWVVSSTDITQAELLSAGGPEERKRFYRMIAGKLMHELAGFSGTEHWYRHGGFWRHEILLTDGVMHLAQNGGRNAGTAFWLVDAVASYQGEKVLVCHPFQVWKLTVTESDAGSRSARLVCTNGNNKEPIIEQKIEYTDFLLEEIQLYASVEPVDESGRKKRVILLLPGEY